MEEIKKNDIWLIYHPVPYKNKNELTRPFLVVENSNNKFYGIPITSFTPERYKKNLGDLTINVSFLSTKSIIKPYQIIHVKKEFFIKKIGTIKSETVKEINKKINTNVLHYLSIKNTHSIIKEFKIEHQIQKITDLELNNKQKDDKIINLEFDKKQLKLELKLAKNKILSQEQIPELE